MPYLIDRIKESLAKEGLTPRTREARAWLMSKVEEMKVSNTALMRYADKSNTIIGKMYFYFYDPKTKEKLRYFDKFPLVLPVEEYKDGFLGLNLHYIHPKFRINLLDKLSETLNNDNYDEKTKFRLTYNYLKSASRLFEATPCIKRYLYNQVRSSFLEIKADEWDIAALLPAENFSGATTDQVHADSRKKF